MLYLPATAMMDMHLCRAPRRLAGRLPPPARLLLGGILVNFQKTKTAKDRRERAHVVSRGAGWVPGVMGEVFVKFYCIYARSARFRKIEFCWWFLRFRVPRESMSYRCAYIYHFFFGVAPIGRLIHVPRGMDKLRRLTPLTRPAFAGFHFN